jgi:glutathione S-transferase
MRLYYSPGACSLAVHILIHELKLPSEFIAVELKTKKTASGEDYLAINSKGSVPALRLENGEVLTENIVIQQYLADLYPSDLLAPVGEMKRYRTLEWLNFISTDLHKSFSPLFNPALAQTVKDEIFIPLLQRRLSYVNTQLADKTFLMGDTFTLPDAYLFVILRWLHAFHLSLPEWPNLLRYFERLHQYPSVSLALKEEGLLKI